MKSALNLLTDAYRRWSQDGGPLLAAGVAYYIALSLFPMLLILISGLGFFFSGTDSGREAEQQLMNAVSEQLSPELGRQLGEVFEQIRGKAHVGGPTGVITLLIAALAMFSQFDHAFDWIWNIEPKSNRGLWHSVLNVLQKRLKALVMLLALGGLIMGVFLAGVILTSIQEASNQILPWSEELGWLLDFGVTLVLNVIAFSLIYRWIPKVDVSWLHAIAGGLFAAIAWEIGRQLLAQFVIGQRYGGAYGVLGTFMAVMLWAYYAVSVLFFGAEFVQALRARQENPESPLPSSDPHVAP